jgi:hypothetical protein
VEGRVLMRDGKLTSHDEQSIVEDGNECARRILTDAGRAASIVV